MDIVMDAVELSQSVQLAIEKRLMIIQLDEFVITKKTWPTHAWTRQKDNLQLNYQDTNTSVAAVLMAISREHGVNMVKVYKKSINKRKFKEFLDELRAKYPFDDMLLMMDNISFHKSQDVRERMDELGFHYTYTVRYSPKYNGIEEVIGIGKQLVKKWRLDAIMKNENENLPLMIVDAYNSIDAQQVAKCITRSLELLELGLN